MKNRQAEKAVSGFSLKTGAELDQRVVEAACAALKARTGKARGRRRLFFAALAGTALVLLLTVVAAMMLEREPPLVEEAATSAIPAAEPPAQPRPEEVPPPDETAVTNLGDLEQLRQSGDMEGLIRILKKGEPFARLMAMKYLLEHPDPQAAEAVKQVLEKQDKDRLTSLIAQIAARLKEQTEKGPPPEPQLETVPVASPEPQPEVVAGDSPQLQPQPLAADTNEPPPAPPAQVPEPIAEAPADEQPAAAMETISGRLFLPDLSPVVGWVRTASGIMETAEDGAFSIPAPVDRFEGACAFDMEKTFGLTFFIGPDTPAEGMDLVLESLSVFEGHVVDPEGGPLAGAAVSLWTEEPENPERNGIMLENEIMTDPDGFFSVEGVPPGAPLRLEIAMEGYLTLKLSVSEPEPETVYDLSDIFLEPTGIEMP